MTILLYSKTSSAFISKAVVSFPYAARDHWQREELTQLAPGEAANKRCSRKNSTDGAGFGTQGGSSHMHAP